MSNCGHNHISTDVCWDGDGYADKIVSATIHALSNIPEGSDEAVVLPFGDIIRGLLDASNKKFGTMPEDKEQEAMHKWTVVFIEQLLDTIDKNTALYTAAYGDCDFLFDLEIDASGKFQNVTLKRTNEAGCLAKRKFAANDSNVKDQTGVA